MLRIVVVSEWVCLAVMLTHTALPSGDQVGIGIQERRKNKRRGPAEVSGLRPPSSRKSAFSCPVLYINRYHVTMRPGLDCALYT
jgi:hypothetical protein